MDQQKAVMLSTPSKSAQRAPLSFTPKVNQCGLLLVPTISVGELNPSPHHRVVMESRKVAFCFFFLLYNSTNHNLAGLLPSRSQRSVTLSRAPPTDTPLGGLCLRSSTKYQRPTRATDFTHAACADGIAPYDPLQGMTQRDARSRNKRLSKCANEKGAVGGRRLVLTGATSFVSLVP